jgi:HSP20 family molecular chaperone IbpA
MDSKKTFFVSCFTVLLTASLFAADNNSQNQEQNSGKLQIQTTNTPVQEQNTLPQPVYISVPDFMDAMSARQARIMDQMMNGMFSMPQGNVNIVSSSYPQSSFITKKDKYILQFAAPGIDKKDIKISLDGKTLSVTYKASKEADSKDSDGSESYQSYTNQFAQYVTAPSDVDADKISSNYKDGVLTVTLPRIELPKTQPKTINVD